MGAVYKARQKELDRIVALKILPPGIGQDSAFAERFAREAKALAKLNHPGIVTIYDFGRAEGLYFFLMEHVDGVNLHQLLLNSRVSPREALAIVPQICEALQFAHDRGIVHRDIKPENVLLDKQGRVKVADFGLAKILDSSSMEPRDIFPQEAALQPGPTGVLGTPSYMAPEQREKPAEVDHRADIYALGVVFYQMLTGELPEHKIEPPSRKVLIDVRLDEIVLRAMEKKPEQRYAQASHLKTDVETVATTPSSSAWRAPKHGWGHLVSAFWGTSFTSPQAYQCASLSALGFLGFLGFFPIPGWKSFFSFAGFFGLIGIAWCIEGVARRKSSTTPSKAPGCWRRRFVRCLMVLGIAATLPFLVVGRYTIQNNSAEPDLPPVGSRVWVWKLGRDAIAGDLVVYNFGGIHAQFCVGRVIDTTEDAVTVNGPRGRRQDVQLLGRVFRVYRPKATPPQGQEKGAGI